MLSCFSIRMLQHYFCRRRQIIDSPDIL